MRKRAVSRPLSAGSLVFPQELLSFKKPVPVLNGVRPKVTGNLGDSKSSEMRGGPLQEKDRPGEEEDINEELEGKEVEVGSQEGRIEENILGKREKVEPYRFLSG